LGYLAGIRQTQATTGAPEKTYEINLWQLHLVLTAGALGVAVMFALTVLLSIAVLLFVIARRRRMRADAASRKLSGAIEDITKLKEAEEVLQHQRNELAQSNAELAAANKELEAFSYSVSHDLRAPLRSIDGFSHALLEDCAAQLNDEGKSYIHRMRAAAQRMGLLIDDLLNLSRLTRAEMKLESVDLSEVGRSIAADLENSEPERQTKFRIQEGIDAYADSRLMKIALENLLGNAWKFTCKRESACVEFGKTDSNGSLIYFVRDNGAGFDPSHAERLFGAFQRLHDKDEFPGTGIGLATVQRIIHRHGGRIWAESAVGQGATFYFTLLEARQDGT
jgi:light-regulated signal transduction histidine kinase (bacteriophytochrome)